MIDCPWLPLLDEEEKYLKRRLSLHLRLNR